MRIGINGPVINGFMFFVSFLLVFNACEKQRDPFDYIQLIGKWEMQSENCKELLGGELLFDETYTYQPGHSGCSW